MATGINMTLSVTGDTKIERILSNAAKTLESSEMMKTYAVMIEGIEEYYRSGGLGRGIPNNAWQEDTRERWPGSEKLDNTGALKDSLTDSDAEGAIRVITPVGFSYGTSLYYSRFVNDGTSRQESKPFLRLNRPILTLLRNVIKDRVGLTPDLRYASGFRPE